MKHPIQKLQHVIHNDIQYIKVNFISDIKKNIVSSFLFEKNIDNYQIYWEVMRYFTSRILFFSVFIPFILITINTGNASPQTSTNSEEKSALYLKLSDLVKNTGDDIVQSMSAIESGDNMSALNILDNVTINLQEISNGLDILVN